MLRVIIKVLHEIGAVGVLGSFACCIVLLMSAPRHAPAGFAAACQGIAAIAHWLLVPALALTVISGLLAIAATGAYIDAGWAWIKALLGLSMFEGTLLTVASSARHAAELSAMAASGHPDAAQLDQMLRTEWGGLWVLLALSVLNIVLAVWRPRLPGYAAP